MTDMAYLLEHAGGWRVGCECHLEVEALVARAEQRGYVGRRLHYAPAHPEEGDPAFELTDDGLAKLRDLLGPAAAAEARRVREWYRTHSSKPISARS